VTARSAHLIARQAMGVTTAVLLLVAGYLAAGWLRSKGPVGLLSPRVEVGTSGRPWRPGDQLVFLFLGSSACTYCHDPDLPGLVSNAQTTLAVAAADLGMRFVSIGVAAGPSVRTGIDYLEWVGTFDQISVGGGWANQVGLSLPSLGLPEFAVTPQFLVYVRTLAQADDLMGTVAYVRHRRVAARQIGIPEIAQWVQGGCPLRVFRRSLESMPGRN